MCVCVCTVRSMRQEVLYRWRFPYAQVGTFSGRATCYRVKHAHPGGVHQKIWGEMFLCVLWAAGVQKMRAGDTLEIFTENFKKGKM